VLVAGVVTLGFFGLFVRKVWAARRQPAFGGAESIVGSSGEAREELAPEGLVFVSGALWKAVAAQAAIHAGAPIRVVGRQGLQLQVVPGEPQASAASKE
jgi:membrane-bound serine protease (ClpP class)